MAGSLLEELRAGELTETEKRRLREELNRRVGETASSSVDHLYDRVEEERVNSNTRALEAEYVTEDDVAETIDEGLDDRLRDVAPFGAGVCLASLGVGLAASAPFWGTVAVLLGGGVAAPGGVGDGSRQFSIRGTPRWAKGSIFSPHAS